LDPLHDPPEKGRDWTLSRIQVKYLLLMVGLRWWWACGGGWLWIIIWVIVTTIWCT
jgi:hypothetical protein